MKANSRDHLRRRMEGVALRAAVAVVRALPLEAAVAVGAALGTFAFSVARARREHVLQSLAASEIGAGRDPAQLQALALRVYRNFGRSLVEYARLPSLGAREIARRVRIEGRSRLDEVLRGERGVILVSGHFGSWQLLGGALARLGYPVNYVAVAQRNREADRIQREIGDALGIRLLAPGIGMRQWFRALRHNEIVIVLADQHAGSSGLVIDFLGRPASTARGPAELALRSGAPILPAFILRRGEGCEHVLEVGKKVAPRGSGPAAGAEVREEEIARLTREHVDALALMVRRHPDQWWWLHRRWRVPVRTPAGNPCSGSRYRAVPRSHPGECARTSPRTP